MNKIGNMAKILSSLGNEKRLQIIKLIETEITNPGKIAIEMGIPRTTVEKHIKMLYNNKLIEKIPTLNQKGHLQVNYKNTELLIELLKVIEEKLK
ncbi:MAG: ArsR/SmtB family transcription factor [Candidatus Hodarchaeales archaeon]|jgi:DNA-binding transcriptional ArsR family regulator